MSRRGTFWHASVLVLAGSTAGCFDMHDRSARDGGSDAPAPPIDAADFFDALVPSADVSEVDLCARAIEALRGGALAADLGCDGRTFPRECSVAVGECCWLAIECAIDPGDGGHLEVSLSCVDSCDQSCGAQGLDDCNLFPYCERFDPGACGPAPEGVIEGPACIGRRFAPCTTDAECPPGTHCQEYWVNPCAGLPCDACGGVETRCSS